MTKREINKEVGKTFFLADDDTLAGRLIYISGIKYFDEYLNGKDQKDVRAVVHVKKRPKGIILGLYKHFSSKKFAINYKDLKHVALMKFNRYSILKINAFEHPIYFGLENDNLYRLTNYFSRLKQISFEENAKVEIPENIKGKLELFLKKNTDVLQIKTNKILASKTKRFFNFIIDMCIVSIIEILFYLLFNVSVSIGFLLIYICYYSITEGAFKTTAGKLITNTKVVNSDGTAITNVFIRIVCRIIPFEALSYLGKSIGWHDRFSKTVVIDKKLRKNLQLIE
ncbi:MAG: RDD family protein [Prevotellaceae bacterium]|jgi:uncharacterized RDD family membrane protein YckC|nr:RDD family protein [Prevotellaceae bacterium]